MTICSCSYHIKLGRYVFLLRLWQFAGDFRLTDAFLTFVFSSSWPIEKKRGAIPFGLVITQLFCVGALLKQPHIALPPDGFLVCGGKHSRCQVHRHTYQMRSHAGLRRTLVFPCFNEYISAHHTRVLVVDVVVCTKATCCLSSPGMHQPVRCGDEFSLGRTPPRHCR